MPLSIRDLKRRMKSVKNTGQITRAMEAVSANKMRKAQQVAYAARPYAVTALQILERVSRHTGAPHWLLEQRKPASRIALIVVTSDKGLCGVFNANIIRAFERFAREHDDWFKNGQCDIIASGKFGAGYLRRRGYNVAMAFDDLGDTVELGESERIAEPLLKAFREKQYDAVFALFTNFITTLKQEAVIKPVLPLSLTDIRDLAGGLNDRSPKEAQGNAHMPYSFNFEYVLEPSPEIILEAILPQLYRIKILHMLLESNASEHSARMIAMKNATDNAEDLFKTLQRTYNKVRQAGITREIAEITGGAAALEG